MTWYAFRTEPQREFAAQEIVNRHGFRAIVPYEWRIVRRSRHAKKKDHKVYPKLVGYLFVETQHPPNWYQMFCMHCLRSVVGFDGQPTPIPEVAIERLLREQGESMPHTLSRNTRRASIMPASHVIVRDGPFRGFEGNVEAINGAAAELLLHIFNTSTPVSVPLDNLEAA